MTSMPMYDVEKPQTRDERGLEYVINPVRRVEYERQMELRGTLPRMPEL